METPSTPTLTETPEEREEREWYETQAEDKRLREEAAAFEPNVGVTVYRDEVDPFAERTPSGRAARCSVGLTITKRTPTTFTVEDGTRYKLATGRYQSDIRSDGTGNGYTFAARQIGRYGQVTAKPLHETVYTKAELAAKLKERDEQKASAEDKARREKLAEIGLSECVAEILADSYPHGAFRALQAILTDEQKTDLVGILFEAALNSTRDLKRLRERLARLSEE